MNDAKENSPWVLLDLSGIIYAVSCNSVLSLSQLPQVTPIPKAPKGVRGVIDFRGKLIELLDMRMMLNIKSVSSEIQEFCEMMDARRQDHLNWIDTLEKCVKEDVEFTLTTDPHKCAFGKWYDSYNNNIKSIMFSTAFSRFDVPHKAIHKIGITAKELVDVGKKQDAIDLIDKVKDTELKQMLDLFEDIKASYIESKREIVVVLGDENHSISIAVDDIVAIEHLSEFDEDLIKNTMTNSEYLAGIGKRRSGSSVILLNDEYLCYIALTKAKTEALANK